MSSNDSLLRNIFCVKTEKTIEEKLDEENVSGREERLLTHPTASATGLVDS